MNEIDNARVRRTKYFEEEIYPQAASAMARDAYRGAHNMIEYAIASIRMLIQQNFKIGMDELIHTTNGSNMKFPDNNYDW